MNRNPHRNPSSWRGLRVGPGPRTRPQRKIAESHENVSGEITKVNGQNVIIRCLVERSGKEDVVFAKYYMIPGPENLTQVI